MADVEQNNRDNVDLAISLVGDKLKRQSDAHQSLEAKMGVTLGFIGIIVGSSIVIVKAQPSLVGINLFSVGLLGLYVCLILLVLASKTQEYLDPPDFPTFYSGDALAKDSLDLKNQVVADMKACYEKNAGIHRNKASLFNWATYAFVFSLLLLFLGVLERKV